MRGSTSRPHVLTGLAVAVSFSVLRPDIPVALHCLSSRSASLLIAAAVVGGVVASPAFCCHAASKCSLLLHLLGAVSPAKREMLVRPAPLNSLW